MYAEFIPLHPDVVEPKYSHIYDAGADITMCRDIEIVPGENIIPMGFKYILPPGVKVQLTPRSSWMMKGLIAPPVPIDSDYSGEWHLCFYNVTDQTFKVKKGERFAQMVASPVVQLRPLSTEKFRANRRGDGGLGSTGK